MISVYSKGTGQAKTIFCIISQRFHVSTYVEKNPNYFKLKDIQGMLFLIYSMDRIFLNKYLSYIYSTNILYKYKSRAVLVHNVYVLQYV